MDDAASGIDISLRHGHVPRRRVDAFVAEQYLDNAQVRAVLKKMSRKAVPQDVRRHPAVLSHQARKTTTISPLEFLRRLVQHVRQPVLPRRSPEPETRSDLRHSPQCHRPRRTHRARVSVDGVASLAPPSALGLDGAAMKEVVRATPTAAKATERSRVREACTNT